MSDINHSWSVTPPQAREIQLQLRQRIITVDRLGSITTVAGVDVGFEDCGNTTRGAVVLLSFPGLKRIDSAIARRPTSFPYVPGLLSFREIPAVLDALEQLKQQPDLLLCDGQGIAHPRRFGIACHLGLLTDIPSIGVAKSRLIGSHREPALEKGSWEPLMDGDERIGAVLRSRTNVSPLYISTGHRICLETAIDYVLACTPQYRLPETTRQAHRLASA
ncbi:MAG: deoxyribonuclease V [Candidatus Sedimenticola sp. 20ELBAFRAG]